MAKEFTEFDDSLLDLAGWKNSRYNGSKLTARFINQYRNTDVSYGLNPVVENRISALFIGNSIESGEDVSSSLEPMVSIKGHSYMAINKILLINLDDDDVEIIDKINMGKTAFNRLVTDSFPEGSKVNIRTLDIGVSNQLKAEHFIKFNQGSLMKVYNYTSNTDGHDDGVAGGFGVRAKKGIVIDDLGLTGSNLPTGQGLFSYGTTAENSRSLFNENSIQFVDTLPSELSMYNQYYDLEVIASGGIINHYYNPLLDPPAELLQYNDDDDEIEASSF